MKSIQIKKEIIEEIEILPCVKCGNDDIKIGDCGYTTFNVAYGECKECGNEIKFNCSWDVKQEDIVKTWNDKNNPVVLIQNYEEQIEKLQEKINELKTK